MHLLTVILVMVIIEGSRSTGDEFTTPGYESHFTADGSTTSSEKTSPTELAGDPDMPGDNTTADARVSGGDLATTVGEAGETTQDTATPDAATLFVAGAATRDAVTTDRNAATTIIGIVTRDAATTVVRAAVTEPTTVGAEQDATTIGLGPRNSGGLTIGLPSALSAFLVAITVTITVLFVLLKIVRRKRLKMRKELLKGCSKFKSLTSEPSFTSVDALMLKRQHTALITSHHAHTSSRREPASSTLQLEPTLTEHDYEVIDEADKSRPTAFTNQISREMSTHSLPPPSIHPTAADILNTKYSLTSSANLEHSAGQVPDNVGVHTQDASVPTSTNIYEVEDWKPDRHKAAPKCVNHSQINSPSQSIEAMLTKLEAECGVAAGQSRSNISTGTAQYTRGDYDHLMDSSTATIHRGEARNSKGSIGSMLDKLEQECELGTVPGILKRPQNTALPSDPISIAALPCVRTVQAESDISAVNIQTHVNESYIPTNLSIDGNMAHSSCGREEASNKLSDAAGIQLVRNQAYVRAMDDSKKEKQPLGTMCSSTKADSSADGEDRVHKQLILDYDYVIV